MFGEQIVVWLWQGCFGVPIGCNQHRLKGFIDATMMHGSK